MADTHKAVLHDNHIPKENQTGHESPELRYPVTMA